MKKLILSLSTAFFSLTLMAAAPVEDVNGKVLAAFATSFKGASEVVWDEYDNMYEVKFKHNDIKSRITYDTDGNILKTMRYYGAENLPLLIRAKVNEKFAGKSIFGITEVSSQDELSYYVVLEDAKHWTTVKCDHFGNFSIYKKLKKA